MGQREHAEDASRRCYAEELLREYEAEHGVITEEELNALDREWKTEGQERADES